MDSTIQQKPQYFYLTIGALSLSIVFFYAAIVYMESNIQHQLEDSKFSINQLLFQPKKPFDAIKHPHLTLLK